MTSRESGSIVELDDVTLIGDVDVSTEFVYEPRPFVDRRCDFRPPVFGEEAVVIAEQWGDYDRRTYCEFRVLSIF